jgi:hypothetical protein
MTIEEEITDLTAKWYKYVNLDHHKDRDCHWYITQTYSYGEEPYYEAHHSGYVIDHWTSPKCGTAKLAQTILRDKLKRELQSAVMDLQDAIKDSDRLDWYGRSVEEIQDMIRSIQ